jgi:hypothetical protein
MPICAYTPRPRGALSVRRASKDTLSPLRTMRSNRRVLLLAAAAASLTAAPAFAQEAGSPASPSGGLVRIDPCTGKPFSARADSAYRANAARQPGHGTTPVAGTPDAGNQPGMADTPGAAHQSGTAPMAGTPDAGHQPGTAPMAGTPDARHQPGTAPMAGTRAAGHQPGAAPVAGAPGAGHQPGAASSAGAPGQTQPAMTSSTSRDNPPGSLFSPTGGTMPDTGRVGDPETAARNRSALRLGSGAVRGAVRLGPAASVSVPTAFGVDAGELFVGVAYQGRTRFTEDDDAAAVAGLGIGTRRVVALEIALTSYSTLRGTPLETGGLSFKLHRGFAGNTSLAVGWENAVLWGGSDDRGSLYAVGTRIIPLRDDLTRPFSMTVVTLGVGNGRFRFEDDYAEDNETVNVFGAVGVRVTDPLSLVADWTGQDLNLAASVTPIRRVPVVITAGVADLTGLAGDGARFILSVGYGLSIRQPFQGTR